MRFLRFVLFAVFWLSVGLGVALLPINGSTVWEKLSSAAASAAAPATGKETHRPLGNYTAEEKANLNKLIQGSTSAR